MNEGEPNPDGGGSPFFLSIVQKNLDYFITYVILVIEQAVIYIALAYSQNFT